MSIDSPTLQVGQIAKHCQVNPRTVHRWIKSGQLKSFAIPSGHFRVHRQEFRQFLIDNDMPLSSDSDSFKQQEIVVIESDGFRRDTLRTLFFQMAPTLKVHFYHSLLEGALSAALVKPKYICLSLDFSKEEILVYIKSLKSFEAFKKTKIFGLGDKGLELPEGRWGRYFEAVLELPFSNKEFGRIFQRYFKEALE